MSQAEKLPAFEVLKKRLNDYGYPQIYDMWYVQAKSMNTKIDPENPVKAIYDERIFMEWNDTDERSVFWSMVHKAIDTDNPLLFSDALNYLGDLKLEEEIERQGLKLDESENQLQQAPYHPAPPVPQVHPAPAPDQVTPLERRQIALDILVALLPVYPHAYPDMLNEGVIDLSIQYADKFISKIQQP